MYKTHKTHTGDIIDGLRLTDALQKVGDDWEKMGYAKRKEDCYAEHIPESLKDANLQDDIKTAQRIREGKESGFWLWQRVNTVLTGECVALLK